jgi:Fe-S cluster biosynthesis and repair protein YggX
MTLTTDDKLTAFLNMLEGDPDNLLALWSVGKLQVEAGRIAEGEKHLRRLLELQPEHSLAHKSLAEALMASGRREEGLELLRKGIVTAHRRGEYHPRNQMQELLRKEGVELPPLDAGGAPSGAKASPDATPGFTCTRCLRNATRQPTPPFGSALGQKIQEQICTDCWQDWMGTSVKVINEYRLNFADPEAQKVYTQILKDYLGL